MNKNKKKSMPKMKFMNKNKGKWRNKFKMRVMKKNKLKGKMEDKWKSKSIMNFMNLHKNKDKHDEIQDKYAAAEEKGKLTDAQAEELMQSKFKKDAGELEIRRKYYASLKAIVGAVKARNIMALSNDKLSKKK